MEDSQSMDMFIFCFSFEQMNVIFSAETFFCLKIRSVAEVCIPRLVFLVPNFFPNFPGNFPSRAFKTSHFPSHLIPTHSRLATSGPVSVPKMKREFPYLKFCIQIPEIPEIQNWARNFLLGTEICFIKSSCFSFNIST